MTGDEGGGGIVSAAASDFLFMFALNRGSCGRGLVFIGALEGSLRLPIDDPPPPPPLIISSSAWTSGSRANDDL